MRKSPYNVEVILRSGESQEKLLKRFLKKCKKSDIIKLYLSKTSHFKTEKEKRKEKSKKRKWLEEQSKLENSSN